VKIAFANHEPFDTSRARALAMLRTVAAVARRNPVTLFSPDAPERLRALFADELQLEWPPGLTAVRLASVYKTLGLTFNGIFLRGLEKALSRFGPDVLWLRSDKLAAHFARKGRWPLVYECHMIGALYRADHGESPRKVARVDRLERDIYAAARGVAVLNGLLEQEVRRRFDYTGPIARIPGAIDPGLFARAWGGGDGRTVVYAGSMQFWKGLETLLAAARHAPELRLRLVGDADNELRARVAAAGLADRVEFCGRVPQRELPRLLAPCACAVHPLPPGLNVSERFTSPLKVFEYLAVGVPVVAPDLPSLREMLQDGVNARLYTPGDADALAAALRQVCTDAALARKLSEGGQQTAGQYTFDARAATLMQLFARVSAE
jgi:glycosyltransferase involved in cell wall biosynthesis